MMYHDKLWHRFQTQLKGIVEGSDAKKKIENSSN
jgi:hypothetical protein